MEIGKSDTVFNHWREALSFLGTQCDFVADDSASKKQSNLVFSLIILR